MIGPHTTGGFKPLKLQGLKARFKLLPLVGPEGPTPLLKVTLPYWDTTQKREHCFGSGVSSKISMTTRRHAVGQ